jgi:hypothetical protein
MCVVIRGIFMAYSTPLCVSHGCIWRERVLAEGHMGELVVCAFTNLRPPGSNDDVDHRKRGSHRHTACPGFSIIRCVRCLWAACRHLVCEALMPLMRAALRRRCRHVWTERVYQHMRHGHAKHQVVGCRRCAWPGGWARRECGRVSAITVRPLPLPDGGSRSSRWVAVRCDHRGGGCQQNQEKLFISVSFYVSLPMAKLGTNDTLPRLNGE